MCPPVPVEVVLTFYLIVGAAVAYAAMRAGRELLVRSKRSKKVVPGIVRFIEYAAGAGTAPAKYQKTKLHNNAEEAMFSMLEEAVSYRPEAGEVIFEQAQDVVGDDYDINDTGFDFDFDSQRTATNRRNKTNNEAFDFTPKASNHRSNKSRHYSNTN